MTEKARLPVTAEEVMNFTHEQRVELAETVAGLLAGAGIDGLTAIKLYGSVAKKQDGPTSDVDLLMIHEGDPDGPEAKEVQARVRQALDGIIPIADRWGEKQAAAGKVSLAFEADEVYRNPTSYYGWAFPMMGLEEMNFLESVRRSAKELWRK